MENKTVLILSALVVGALVLSAKESPVVQPEPVLPNATDGLQEFPFVPVYTPNTEFNFPVIHSGDSPVPVTAQVFDEMTFTEQTGIQGTRTNISGF